MLTDDDIRIVLRTEASRVKVPVEALRERIRRADVRPDPPSLWQRLKLGPRLEAAAAALVLGMVVMIGANRGAPEPSLHTMLRSQPPDQMNLRVHVQTEGAPAGHTVEIMELGLKARTDGAGQALLGIPVGKAHGAYTFAVTSPERRYTTYVRERVSPSAPNLFVKYDPQRQVFQDHTRELPKIDGASPPDLTSPPAAAIVRYAELVTSGDFTAAAQLLAPNLQTPISLMDYTVMRNTPVMEVISLVDRTGALAPDPGARSQPAEARVYAMTVRYRVLGLTESGLKDGEAYRHKVTVIRLTPGGPWLISELSGPLGDK